MPDKPRQYLALLTEYDGSAFSGWQIQPRQRTVQAVLRDAIRTLTGEDIRLTGCSRTDAGVHARGHVSSFSACSRIVPEKWPLALNSVLPPDISVQAAATVPEAFNARRDARGKIYSYTIWRPAARPAILRRTCAHVPGRLDLDAMAGALPLLLGRRDFRALCDAGSPALTTMRTIQALRLISRGPLVTLYVQGDGFLYHMMRILTGTLLAVAEGKLTACQMTAIIESGDRRKAGKTMPPEGLCLEHVQYQPAVFGPWREPVKEEGEWDVHVALE
ncbi:MAG: tRNA pseudouridine(38-40) synthase TruA [Clostridiaceae bacterium]|jgi:tRNA pseudouridine38-40 synthase|nr:tRNA pseudouridine(38-40) synthase TruA [Clostridiaceae bacterium]